MRKILFTLTLSGLLWGCQSKGEKMSSMMQQAAPAPQMKQLEKLVGTWSGTAEFVEPTREQMMANMPEGEELPEYFKGGSQFEFTLGGYYAYGEGWHESMEGEQEKYIEYITWDPKIKKFRSFFFSNTGERGSGTFSFDGDGNVTNYKAKGQTADGRRMSGQGTWTFVDANTMNWTWTGHTPMGKMKLKGTSRRQ